MSIFARIIKYLTADAAYKTAVHELGHCAVIKYYKGNVANVAVNATGHGGYTYFDYMPNDKQQLRVLVAGYVAERMLEGKEPTFPIRGGCYEGDMALIRELKATDDDIQCAIKAAQRIIGRPETFEYIRQTAFLLAEVKFMTGESVKL
jgi:hypothetical protein